MSGLRLFGALWSFETLCCEVAEPGGDAEMGEGRLWALEFRVSRGLLKGFLSIGDFGFRVLEYHTFILFGGPVT